ncbi:MAG: hypothetical protein Fur002_22280 [Anaerolineales bacterium]
MFAPNSIAAIIFFSSLVNAVIFIASWRRKNSEIGAYFSWGMLGLTLWTLSEALDYAAISLDLKIVLSKVEALGYISAIAMFARFSISLAGNDRWMDKKWVKILFYALPVSNILLVWTNELHRWVWVRFTPLPNNMFVFEHGVGFDWMVLNTYALLLVIFVNLWHMYVKGSAFARRQAIWLMLALIFPILTNSIYHQGAGGAQGVDWTSVTFSITGAIFLYALYGIRFLDIIPIARDKLFNHLSDGMIVLDIQNRVIDANSIANTLFKHPAIGTNLAQVTPFLSAVFERPLEEEIKTEADFGDTDKIFFDVKVSPLYGERKKIIGRLLIFRDVTGRKMAGLALERQLAEIQKLHRELQESQTLILEQQRALTRIEERRQIARDMHDSVNQSIHSLMLFSETLVALLEKNRTQDALNLAKQIQESGKRALKDIRLLIYRAQSISEKKEVDIVSALEERLNMVERRVGITASIFGAENAAYCPAERSEDLYWIIAEALNNSLKHAQARHVTISFAREKNEIEVKVTDDGAGFETEKIRAGGFGMKSMAERAALIGGTLTVTSTLGVGAQVIFKSKPEVSK